MSADRLPECLVIGAMKAGTTSLWGHLRAHPQIFMPRSKEPETLRFADAAGSRGRKRYAELFSQAGDGQLCAEASTLYSKLPDSEAIAGRARALLGPDLKLIYMVREPLARAISHHRHLWRNRWAPASFDAALAQHSGILEYGLYSRQLQPWLAHYGLGNILVLRFEDFVENSAKVLDRLYAFLGVDAADPAAPDNPELRLNAGDVTRVPRLPFFNDSFYRLRMTHTYKRLSESALFAAAKPPLKRLFASPLPADATEPPGDEVLRRMQAAFAADARELAAMLNWQLPIWPD